MTTDLFAVRGSLRAAIAPATSGRPTPRASTADAPRSAVATIVAPDEASQGHREPHLFLVAEEPVDLDRVALATLMSAVRTLQDRTAEQDRLIGDLRREVRNLSHMMPA